MVEAWRFYQSGDKTKLHTLVKQLLAPKYHQEILDFIEGEDVKPLDKNDPQYARSLIVADIKESDFIKNNDPAEVRYNVKQTLHYLTDWLAGNGLRGFACSD
jgi:malate synthase